MGTVKCLDGKRDFFGISTVVRNIEKGSKNKVAEYKINKRDCKEFGLNIAIRTNLKPSVYSSETVKRRTEAILSRAMSDAKISPKIHGVIKKPGEIYSYAMDMMDGDLVDLFTKSRSKETVKSKVEERLKKLFQRMAKMGLYCIDIKLENAVYKTVKGKTDIRLIDFEPSWCEKIEVLLKENPVLLKDFRKRKDKERLVGNVMMFIFLVNSEDNRVKLGLKSPFFGSYFANMSMTDIDALGVLLNKMKTNGGEWIEPIYIMNHYHKKPIIGRRVIDYLNFIKKLKRFAFGNTRSPIWKKCPKGKILNPFSNRYVLRTGKIGREL